MITYLRKRALFYSWMILDHAVANDIITADQYVKLNYEAIKLFGEQ